jgi:hypothetical protein
VTRQAWTVVAAKKPRLTSKVSASMAMTAHPPSPVKAERSSSWLTRRGPAVPGCLSLKHMRYSRPPGRSTDARLATYLARLSSSNTWNSPLSMIVSKLRPRSPSRKASATANPALIPRAAALPLARSMASGETSTPRASAPKDAASRVCSPVPQPASSNSPVSSPRSASRTKPG